MKIDSLKAGGKDEMHNVDFDSEGNMETVLNQASAFEDSIGVPGSSPLSHRPNIFYSSNREDGVGVQKLFFFSDPPFW